MEDRERAEFCLGLAASVKDSLATVLGTVAENPDEREQMAGAVIALLLRDMYRARGPVWLETILKQVL